MLLENQIAIVTGASQGIGKGIAELFVKNGAKVIICARNASKLYQAAEDIGRNAGTEPPMAIPMDVSDKKQVVAMVEKVMDAFGKIDILVNNAAVQIFHPFLEIPEEIWDLHYSVNIKGVFLFSQAVGKIMAAQGRGRIINISSDSGVAPVPNHAAAYCSTKSAVNGLTRNIAKELGPYGVYCNSICPGAIAETGMMEYFYSVSEKTSKDHCEAAALKRMGTPEDIAKVALFLACDMSGFITGEHILATGGALVSQ